MRTNVMTPTMFDERLPSDAIGFISSDVVRLGEKILLRNAIWPDVG